MEKILIFTILSVILLKFSRSQNPCITPAKEDGICIALRECPSLFGKLLRRPLAANDRQFLKQSQCDYKNNTPYVCCPPQNDTTTKALPPGSEKLPQPGQCGIHLANDKIIKGVVTDVEEYPWIALLEYYRNNDNSNDFYCGGALIHESYVLTSAHCVVGKEITSTNFTLKSVRLGEWNTKTDVDCSEYDDKYCNVPPLNVNIAETIVHPQFSSESLTSQNNIALLRLEKSVSFTDFIRPICLLITEENGDVKLKNMEVSGWALTKGALKSDVKIRAIMEEMPTGNCTEKYSTLNVTLTNDQLCAVNVRGEESCHGDPGGPLMNVNIKDHHIPYFYIVGINSFRPKLCGQDVWPNVYTKVNKFTDWIISNIH